MGTAPRERRVKVREGYAHANACGETQLTSALTGVLAIGSRAEIVVDV